MRKLWISICVLLLLSGCSSPFVGTHVGYGYLNEVPAEMSGHGQFDIGVEVGTKITDTLEAVGYWQHYSNGAGLGLGEYPNGRTGNGMNFIGIKLRGRYDWR